MLDLLRNSPGIFGAYIVLLGLCVGSFLNVVIYRLPLMLKRQWQAECCEFLSQPIPPVEEKFNLLIPRSRCPACGHAIAWYENIPVLSWLALRGRCSACASPISWRYPLIELVTALLSLVTYLALGASPECYLALPVVWALIALTMIDLDEQLLPDNMTLPLLWAGLLANTQHLFTTPTAAIIGATAGYLSLWTVYWLFKLATGKEGMGYGDFKLLAALGAWLGWQVLPLIILLSAAVGAVAGVGYMLIRKQSLAFPFGPYLAMAGFIALLWQKPLMHWYLGI